MREMPPAVVASKSSRHIVKFDHIIENLKILLPNNFAVAFGKS